MNLKIIQPKNETEDILLSITKNCETLITQTHRKAEGTLEFKMTKPRETFHFNPSKTIIDSRMVGLSCLEVYNSVFKITEKITNSKFINFLIQGLLVFLIKKSKMKLKKTWRFQILQIPIYKMK